MSNDLFTKYDRPMTVSAEECEVWHYFYLTLIERMEVQSVSTVEFETSVRKGFETKPASTELTNLVDTFTSDLFSVIDKSPSDALHAYNLLSTLTSQVKDERDYHVKQIARLTKPKATVGAEFLETKSDAKAIAELLLNFLGMSRMGMFDWPDSIGTKVLKSGKTVLATKVPHGPKDGAGRKAANANLRLTVDGEFYGDSTIAQVCHDVLSDSASRVNEQTLIATVGDTFSSGWDTPITVNGHEVIGTRIDVGNDADTDDDDDQDDDE